MSAISYTDWTILCDGEGCPRQLSTQDLDMGAMSELATAAGVRRTLRKRGWAVSVPNAQGSRRRRDFCPDHKEVPRGGASASG